MYATLLLIHSWVRWIVVGTLIASIVRFHPRLRTITLAVFDTQLLLGVLLYAVGPMTPRSPGAFGAYMKISMLRFFTLEHPFAMVVAAAVLHVFFARSRRAGDEPLARRRMAIGAALALGVVLIGIPWPGLPYARPLFRLP